MTAPRMSPAMAKALASAEKKAERHRNTWDLTSFDIAAFSADVALIAVDVQEDFCPQVCLFSCALASVY